MQEICHKMLSCGLPTHSSGCFHRQSVNRVMQLYKERFIAKLSESEKASADFSRPVFLAVAFYLVARKNKVRGLLAAVYWY